MHKLGHYGAALLLYAPVGFVSLLVAPELAFVGGVVVLVLSTLPDVDLRLPGVAHRGPTHTVAFLAAVSMALAVGGWLVGADLGLGPRLGLTAFGAILGAVGIGSHLLADVVTPMGVRPFWPVSDARYTLALTPASNPVANWLLLVLGALVTGVALVVGGRVG